MAAFQVLVPNRVADHHTQENMEFWGVKDKKHRLDEYVWTRFQRLYKDLDRAMAQAKRKGGKVLDYNRGNACIADFSCL